MRTLAFRTECNHGSKYFADIASALRHFYKCVAGRNNVELWVVYDNATQTLLDCFYLR